MEQALTCFTLFAFSMVPEFFRGNPVKGERVGIIQNIKKADSSLTKPYPAALYSCNAEPHKTTSTGTYRRKCGNVKKSAYKKEPSHGAPDGAGCMIGFRVYRNRAARSGIFSASIERCPIQFFALLPLNSEESSKSALCRFEINSDAAAGHTQHIQNTYPRRRPLAQGSRSAASRYRLAQGAIRAGKCLDFA